MTERVPPTEAVDSATRGLDRMTTAELVGTLVGAQRRAVEAVTAARPQIVRAVEEIARRLRAGGRLHYVGAGTSGRLGFLDAAEAPPTFGTSPSLVRAHIAGGTAALTEAVEGAEDDIDAARELVAQVESGDVVIGISASGGAAYVVNALAQARAKGTYTIAITSAADSTLARRAELAIVLETGAEPLAGSTRLVAGTAQKIVLNTLSTATMVRLGKIYDNLMVDLEATNEKLRARALRLVRELAEVADDRAREALEAADWRVKVAVVMLRRGVDAVKARELLAAYDGSLREVLESR